MKKTIITMASIVASSLIANAQIVYTASDTTPTAGEFTLDLTSAIGSGTALAGGLTSTTRTGASTPHAIKADDIWTSGAGVSGVINYYLFNGQTYDPSGEAASSTFSLTGAKAGIFDDGADANQTLGFYAKQGGVRYLISIPDSGTVIQNTWQFLTSTTDTLTGITSTGGLVEFGFYTANSTSADAPTSTPLGTVFDRTAQYDDLSVRLRVNPVPEPSSTALLGLGALGLLIRRKR